MATANGDQVQVVTADQQTANTRATQANAKK